MKNTHSLNTDSLINIDELIEKYTQTTNNEKTKPGDRIWSEPIFDDFIKFSDNQASSTKPLSNTSKYNNENNIKLTSTLNNESKRQSNNEIKLTTKFDDFESLDNKKDFDYNFSKLKDSHPKTQKIMYQDVYKTTTLFMDEPETKPNKTESAFFDYGKMDEQLKSLEDKVQRSRTKTLSLDDLEESTYNDIFKTQKFSDEIVEHNDTKEITPNRFTDLDDLYGFNKNHTKPVISFKTKPLTTNTSTSANSFESKQKEVSNFTRMFYEDTETSELTKEFNTNQHISFNTTTKLDEKKTGFFGFFQKKVGNAQEYVGEIVNEKKSARNDFKETWSKVPGFYRFEHLVARINFYFVSLILLASICTFGYVLWEILNLGSSNWLLLPQCSFNLFALGLFIYGVMNYNNIKKELKINSYIITNENVTPYIKRKYKSLCSSYIVLNWTCLSVYLCSGLTILLLYIIGYFHNLINNHESYFGNLIINGNDNVMLVVMWTMVVLIIFFFCWQMSSFFINRKRKNEIELFYQKDIITDEMIQKYKKAANKKGIAIFLTSTIAISLVVILVWLILRRVANITITKKNK